MIKILFLGDPHFTENNTRETDILRENVCKLASEHKPDIIILGGDQLHNMERMHITPVNNLCKLVKELRRLCPVYVLVGNHEMCFGENTPVLKWDGSVDMIQNIKIGDILVSGEGKPTKVTKCLSGKSNMFLVHQQSGIDYIVNDSHILTLKVGYHKSIFWNNTKNVWTVKWLSDDLFLKSKFFNIRHNTIEEAKYEAEQFLRSIPNKDIINIPIQQYFKIPVNVRNRLYGFKGTVNWEKKPVLIDPYILGMWLGDGSKEGAEFSSADIDLIYKWWIWARNNGANIIHHSSYNYNICNSTYTRKDVTSRIDIFEPENSTKKCPGCIKTLLQKRSPSLACASIEEIKLLIIEDEEIVKYFCTNASKEQLLILKDKNKLREIINWKNEKYPLQKIKHKNNPLRFLLKKYNLIGHKHIPKDYIINDTDTRLRLLAGFIDTDGHKQGGTITISQSQNNKKMILDLDVICKSLGLTSFVKKKHIQNIITISGDIDRIPTIIERKISKSRNPKDSKGRLNRDLNKTLISIKPLDYGKYYGITVEGNGLFLLEDNTVVHNCNNQQFLTENHSLNMFKQWEGVTVVDKPVQVCLKGYKFTLLPYVPVGRFEEALNTLETTESKQKADYFFDWRKSDCIFAHQEFKGCKMGAIVSEHGDAWPLDYPFVISGHIHSTQRPQKNIYYPGSSTQVAFGENESPIVALAMWTSPEEKEPNIEEVDLGLPTKKIVYTDSEAISEFDIDKTLKEGQDPSLLKISVSGDSHEFKTFKKSKKYEELTKRGVKVVFKPKRAEILKNKEELEVLKKMMNSSESDVSLSFKEILYSISLEKGDSDMFEIYEYLVNGNSIESGDVLIL